MPRFFRAGDDFGAETAEESTVNAMAAVQANATTEGLADAELRGVLDEFRSDVEVLLPGYYSWHQPASYHCTLRALKADAPAVAGSTTTE